ncbi:hypothetical protein THAOC_23573, partial [Thalassiosira oceanica]
GNPEPNKDPWGPTREGILNDNALGGRRTVLDDRPNWILRMRKRLWRVIAIMEVHHSSTVIAPALSLFKLRDPRPYETYGHRVADLLARHTQQLSRLGMLGQFRFSHSRSKGGVQDAGVTTEVSTESDTIVPMTTTCWLVGIGTTDSREIDVRQLQQLITVRSTTFNASPIVQMESS